ncbi:hypothetical protein HanXRQr2_Chr17g0805101 [Helianthus annuus]|uniref:Uncharacterized protein n=1 Tax=Helianthus annuus TaxID=4232 RepID=A0A9K3DIH0_HELAN|nr:hypothetical protein HanXRQr2_Chr17g0805101 [Helianthus annuus]
MVVVISLRRLPPSPHRLLVSSSSEVLWPRLLIRKWLNRSSRSSEYDADSEDDDTAYGTDGDVLSYVLIRWYLIRVSFCLNQPQ